MTEEPKRIYELAKEYKISSNAMLTILRDLDFSPRSHMSQASDEMVAAIKQKFEQQKVEAKKEMEQQEAKQRQRLRQEREEKERQRKAKLPPPLPVVEAAAPGSAVVRKTDIGTVAISNSKSEVAGVVKKIEKRQKRKERRRNKTRRQIDQEAVAKSFKSVMADLSGGRTKRKHRREAGDLDEFDSGPTNVIEVNEYMSVAELAKMLDRKPADLIAKLFQMGMMATINQRLDMDTIEMLAGEYEYAVTRVTEIGDYLKEEESAENLAKRAPVVTVMGHVDHGKTSLLDYIRKTNVVAGESGAITQHIGAYEVDKDGERIVFLDTPGHEAFTAMRARGAQITDIVVLVVAADDGVRPQTVEAIDHARAAGVPIIVAINKIDKPTANPDTVRTELSKHNLLAESWGGKTIMVEVSAKKGDNIDRLLEMILLQAEMLDLKADPSIRGQGVVVDARLERGLGPVTTVLIQRGTCRIGDSVVAGTHFGRIRRMTNDRDQQVTEIGPSTPAQITGLDGVPQAGDSFVAVRNDQEAKEIVMQRGQVRREQDARRTMGGGVTLDKILDRIKEGQVKELRLIIKADVDGSVEVISDTLGKIETSEVKTTIIHGSVGAISESDVLLAAASNAIIIGFQVSIDSRARELAKQETVDIRQYDIIYEAESDVKKALEGMLSPELSEQFAGLAEVRQVFRVPKIGLIAGCYVREGRISRRDRVRVIRDGKIIYAGVISSLKRFKDDAREVKEGFECGIGVENYNDIKVGDSIEAIEVVETARTLD